MGLKPESLNGTNQAAEFGFINYGFHSHKEKNGYNLRRLEMDPSLFSGYTRAQSRYQDTAAIPNPRSDIIQQW